MNSGAHCIPTDQCISDIDESLKSLSTTTISRSSSPTVHPRCDFRFLFQPVHGPPYKFSDDEGMTNICSNFVQQPLDAVEILGRKYPQVLFTTSLPVGLIHIPCSGIVFITAFLTPGLSSCFMPSTGRQQGRGVIGRTSSLSSTLPCDSSCNIASRTRRSCSIEMFVFSLSHRPADV